MTDLLEINLRYRSKDFIIKLVDLFYDELIEAEVALENHKYKVEKEKLAKSD